MTDLKRMRDFCPKPSDAVQALARGLKTATEEKDFRIKMGRYSYVNHWSDEKICFGDAPTCAILEALDLWPRMREYAESRGRGADAEDAAEVERITGVAWDDLRRFEIAINELRGDRDVEFLRKYYEVDISRLAYTPDLNLLLDNSVSRQELKKYWAFSWELKAAGL